MKAPAVIAAAASALAVALAPQPAAAGTFRGELEVTIAEDLAGRASGVERHLVAGGHSYRLHARGADGVRPGSRVVVRGSRSGGAIRGRVVRATPPARRSTIALGPRKVGVIMFNFDSDRSEPWQRADARYDIFGAPGSANAFYQEESHGRISLEGKLAYGDVFGWFTIAASPSGCQLGPWREQARAAAVAAGVDLSGYDHLIYAFPRQADCDFAGIAKIGDSELFLNGTVDPYFVAHELGHNLGLLHASSYECRDAAGRGVPLGPYCEQYEYSDFDAQGARFHRHHGWHLKRLGLLAGGQVQTVTATGSYTLRSSLNANPDVQLLRIPRGRGPAGEDSYYLDFRTAGGAFDTFAPTHPVVNGVSVRLARDSDEIYSSYLLDTTPDWQTEGRLTDAALAVGRTFDDGAVRITTTAISGDTATVTIELTPDTQAPTAPNGLRFFSAGRLTWQPSSDNVLVERYTILRDGVEVATFDRDDPAARTTLGYIHDGLHPAKEVHLPVDRYRGDRGATFEVVAHDPAGNRSQASAPLIVPAPNPPQPPAPPAGTPRPPQPPTARPTLPSLYFTWRRKGRHGIVIAADSPRHLAVARIDIRIDRKRHKTVRGTYARYQWNTRRARKGWHTITATAYNRAGQAIARSTEDVRTPLARARRTGRPAR